MGIVMTDVSGRHATSSLADAPPLAPCFDVERDRAVVRDAVAVDIRLRAKHRRKGDLYLLALLPAVVVAIGALIGAYADPLFLGAAVVSACPAALLWRSKSRQSFQAFKRISERWVEHFQRFGPHAANGEPVSVVYSNEAGSVVRIAFEDGCTTDVDASALCNGDGEFYPSDGATHLRRSAETLRRWCGCRWRTDDGRTGTARDFQYQRGSDGEILPRLLLKLPDGHAWFDPTELSPAR